MSRNDIAYYRRRATEERERALAADRQDVAAIHLELAGLYDAMRPKLHVPTRVSLLA